MGDDQSDADVLTRDEAWRLALAPPVAEGAMKRVIIALAVLVLTMPAVAQDTGGSGCNQVLSNYRRDGRPNSKYRLLMGRGIYDCRQLMHGCLNTKIPKLGGTKQGCPRALHTQLLFAAPERGLSKRRLGAFKYPADNGAHAIGAVTENEARDHSHNCKARVHLHLLHIRRKQERAKG